MKVISGVPGSHFGVRLLRITALAALALGITLTFLLTAGPVEADGQDGFTVPIVPEEGRTPPPDEADPPSTPEPPQVRTEADPPRTPVLPDVRKIVPIVPEGTRDAPKLVRGNGGSIRQAIPNPSTLIKNTAQTPLFTNDFDHDYAQAFTTGSHSDGYKLTSVKMFMLTSGAQPSYSVKIHKDSSGAPDMSTAGTLGTLSGGTSLSSTLTLETFTAPGTGISLDATTTYWLVMDVGSSNTAAKVSIVNTDNEDSGGAAGWTIADDRRVRAFGQTAGWGGIGNRPAEFRMAVEGYAKVKSELVSAEITGAKLVLTFDQDLDTTSGTAPGAFTVKIDGTAHTPSAISISGRQVTLTVPEATQDQSVTVSYAKPGSNPLKSSDGPEVASFTDQAVTHARIDRLSQPPRAPILVTYTNADGDQETVENRAASAERDTLWDYFYDSCSAQRSVTTVHDYTQKKVIDLPGGGTREVMTQARNGWKWVEVQNAKGEVTGTRPQTLTECASHGMYLRQAQCANEDWLDRNPHLLDAICPTYRTW